MRYQRALAWAATLGLTGCLGSASPRSTALVLPEAPRAAASRSTTEDEPTTDAPRRSNEELLRTARLTDLEPAKPAAEAGMWAKFVGRFRPPEPQPVSLPRTDRQTGDVFEEPPRVHVVPDDF